MTDYTLVFGYHNCYCLDITTVTLLHTKKKIKKKVQKYDGLYLSVWISQLLHCYTLLYIVKAYALLYK